MFLGCLASQSYVEDGSQEPDSNQRGRRNQPQIQSWRCHDSKGSHQSTWILWNQPPDGNQRRQVRSTTNR